MLTVCSNKADLAIINRIRAELKPQSSSLAAAALSSLKQLSYASGALPPSSDPNNSLTTSTQGTSPTVVTRGANANPNSLALVKRPSVTAGPKGKWKLVLAAVRFVVRVRRLALAWQRYERLRQKLEEVYEGLEREERIRRLREEWVRGVEERQKEERERERGWRGRG